MANEPLLTIDHKIEGDNCLLRYTIGDRRPSLSRGRAREMRAGVVGIWWVEIDSRRKSWIGQTTPVCYFVRWSMELGGRWAPLVDLICVRHDLRIWRSTSMTPRRSSRGTPATWAAANEWRERKTSAYRGMRNAVAAALTSTSGHVKQVARSCCSVGDGGHGNQRRSVGGGGHTRS